MSAFTVATAASGCTGVTAATAVSAFRGYRGIGYTDTEATGVPAYTGATAATAGAERPCIATAAAGEAEHRRASEGLKLSQAEEPPPGLVRVSAMHHRPAAIVAPPVQCLAGGVRNGLVIPKDNDIHERKQWNLEPYLSD